MTHVLEVHTNVRQIYNVCTIVSVSMGTGTSL